MKRTILLSFIPVVLVATLFTTVVNAQVPNVGIGTALPDTNALLEIKSINKGILLPRLADTSLVHTPVEGLFIYNKNTKTPFFHDGVKWQGLSRALSTLAFGDSVTYTMTGIGTATEFPATSLAESFAAGAPNNTFSFTKKLDVNTVPLQQAILVGTIITSIEFRFYVAGASTPTISVKLTGVTLLSDSYAFANASLGGLSDQSYAMQCNIYGFKNWVTGQSFGYNFSTHAVVPY
jgi:hypothetical protein